MPWVVTTKVSELGENLGPFPGSFHHMQMVVDGQLVDKAHVVWGEHANEDCHVTR